MNEDFVSVPLEELKLSNWLVDQCKQIGYKSPTPIQYHCIPRILNDEDVIGCAKTGSGKTAAFALPIIQKLSEDPFGIFALILTPTRELAYQIADQFRILGKPINIKDCVITGGIEMTEQAIQLSEKPHIVISTPGRLADHIESGTNFSLSKIQMLVKNLQILKFHNLIKFSRFWTKLIDCWKIILGINCKLFLTYCQKRDKLFYLVLQLLTQLKNYKNCLVKSHLYLMLNRSK